MTTQQAHNIFTQLVAPLQNWSNALKTHTLETSGPFGEIIHENEAVLRDCQRYLDATGTMRNVMAHPIANSAIADAKFGDTLLEGSRLLCLKSAVTRGLIIENLATSASIRLASKATRMNSYRHMSPDTQMAVRFQANPGE